MSKEGLYALTIMPPPELSREIQAIRLEFSERYQCREALKPPVHITLIPPFKRSEKEVETVFINMKNFAKLQIPFPVTLKDYDCFAANEVIFMNVMLDDLLSLFQKNLEQEIRKWLPGIAFNTHPQYHPHVTLGYRDIPEGLFDAARLAYSQRKFFATFICDAMHLWKHNGDAWEVHRSFYLGTMAEYQIVTDR